MDCRNPDAEGYFPDFMAFFFPEAAAEIDWSQGLEALDKELAQVVQVFFPGLSVTLRDFPRTKLLGLTLTSHPWKLRK